MKGTIILYYFRGGSLIDFSFSGVTTKFENEIRIMPSLSLKLVSAGRHATNSIFVFRGSAPDTANILICYVMNL